jgi:hypothetical protein
MRKLLAASTLALCAFAFTGWTPAGAAPTTAQAPASEAGSFVGHINALREAHGLNDLQTYGELNSIAQRWAQQMADAGAISHNANLPNEVSAPWQSLGENVGVGTDVDGLFTAFVNSPAHYRNLVDPDYGYVGVGVVWGADGRLYTCHVFMGMGDTPPAPGADGASAPSTKATPTAAAHSSVRAHTTAPAVVPPPPPPPQGPAEPARVVTVLVALHSLSG